MEVKNGKIIKATDLELYSFWLTNWSDIYSYTDYKNQCIQIGVEVTDDND